MDDRYSLLVRLINPLNDYILENRQDELLDVVKPFIWGKSKREFDVDQYLNVYPKKNGIGLESKEIVLLLNAMTDALKAINDLKELQRNAMTQVWNHALKFWHVPFNLNVQGKVQFRCDAPIPKKRELKFRVWDKLEKRFTMPESIGQQHYVLDLSGEFTNLQNGSGGLETVVQQYTGLKDGNGKDLYEGDIIWMEILDHGLSCKAIFQICWRECGFVMENKEQSPSPIPKCFFIAGNIFENPDFAIQKE